ncbi:uncharacterized protein LOC120436733 [Oreochromis aureus]|uniref:uncharacterized protein LOC120436733 n=1 Tax=Oreochromis aureus TaxID=47969 RepID=UPI001953771B|nr:uncharacterized protein LOC120436733 [Oreochromis aureus]
MDSAGRDPAAQDPVAQALIAQGAALARHEQMLERLHNEMAALTQAVARLTPLESNPQPAVPAPQEPPPAAVAAVASAPSAPQPPSDGPLPTPEPFTGEWDKCAGFLAQCTLVFREQRRFHNNDGAKITFFVQLLRDRALKWAQVVLSSDPGISYADFLSKFHTVFNKGSGAEAAALRLLNFKQGKRSMSDYSIDFWILAEETGWGQEALRSALLNNVREEVKDELIMRDLPDSLTELMALCIKVDDRLRARRLPRHYSSQEAAGQLRAGSSSELSSSRQAESADGGEQPMQIGGSHLSAAERQRRITAGRDLATSSRTPCPDSSPPRKAWRTLHPSSRQPVWWGPSPGRSSLPFARLRERSRIQEADRRGAYSFPKPSGLRPWSHISLDFVTGLPPSAGNTVILTIVDRFSKAAHFVALPKLPTALETARPLTNHVFRLHGIPDDIVSDRGPQFTSRVWKEFCASFGSKVSLSSGYHPQSNGQSERANQELEAALRCVASSNQAVWSEELPWIEYAHNSMTTSATGRSPFEASLGFQPPLFPSIEGEHSVPSVQAHLRRCRRVWKATRAALLRTKDRNKRFADRHRSSTPPMLSDKSSNCLAT